MAARFRKIYQRTFKDEGIMSLPALEKLIAIYCIVEQSNRIGIFTFSLAMAAEDLCIAVETFLDGFRNVCQTLDWRFDHKARVLYIPSWWRYNTPENFNVLKGNLADLHDLPKTELIAEFGNNLGDLPETLYGTFREWFSKRSGEPSPNQEQKQEQKQKQDKKEPPPTGGLSAKDADQSKGKPAEKFATPEWLMERWNTISGIVPCKALVGSVLKSVNARIKEHPTQSWWEQFLTEEVEPSDYLCGRVNDWAASLDWICGPKNMSKIRSGKYRNRDTKSAASIIVSCTNRIKDGRSLRPCLKPVAEGQRGMPKPLCPDCVVLKDQERKRIAELGGEV